MSIEVSNNNKKINKLYETNKDSIVLLPKGVTKEDIEVYINRMTELAKPRLIRNSGRPSNNVDDYAIPANYFPVESNTVNFNLSEGFYSPSVDAMEEKATIFGKEIKVFNGVTANDMGTFICLYLFQWGRKTVDELQQALTSYDPILFTLLINKLKEDGFVKIWKEEDGLETIELITKEERFKALGVKEKTQEDLKKEEKEKEIKIEE